ncbi:hypothetical protein C4B63_485g3 [Trypanosoma cruzi]|uniref:Uncharacterized protein n=1 Tax=Trypanosoma cruzi TaxID=5693 RepID=A0A2V2UFB9_TRYCR|nr:hypothetical protein C4B63_485g3 [Trypanosoma cruzi]
MGVRCQRWKGGGYIAQAVERRLADPSSTKRMLTTSKLLHIILDELCEAFLPDPTLVLNEADAIDSMLPFVRQRESEQVDVLRRSLRLRRRLAVHRRLLLSKVNLLEQLGRPVMRTLLAFITADFGEHRECPAATQRYCQFQTAHKGADAH